MGRAMFDFARALIAATAIFGAGAFAQFPMRGTESLIGPGPIQPEVAVPMAGQQAAEPQGDTVTPDQQVGLLQWGLREGGAFTVILVILFFYRRDWKTAVDFWRDQHAITTELVQQCTKAMAEMAAALRENTTVVHQAKNVMARQPQTRAGDFTGD